MYRYDEFDEKLVRERVQQFREMIQRRLDGSLVEDEFTLLRQMNGVYLQLHAYMLRICVPYGTFSPRQLRQIALIADKYDRGYCHFTTRTNIQFNWPRLRDIPDICDLLADVEMHCIQTSGNCIRNTTADQFSGVAADEIEDPRITAELIRQWSTLHPEFSFLPRKFKFAITASSEDRAAVAVHDIGLRILRSAEGEVGYKITVGGGLGRAPFLGKTVREFLPKKDLFPYLEAILRVYNLEGRRDNKWKARIKILVHELGTENFIRRVEEEYARIEGPSYEVSPEDVARIAAYFAPPVYEDLPATSEIYEAERAANPAFARFADTNLFPHKVPGYTAITVSLKPIGGTPGDISSDQMRALADIGELYSLNELRSTHVQNLVLPHVKLDDLPEVWRALTAVGLATANAGLITDIISCPGMDYCKLATARSIPIAQAISKRFADEERQRLIGEIGIKMSGCINACGHHHVGGIGILGLERMGVENYQITLGGHAGNDASLGERLGPGIDGDAVPDAIERIVDIYLDLRSSADEPFIETVRRVGLDPFKPALQPQEVTRAAA